MFQGSGSKGLGLGFRVSGVEDGSLVILALSLT